MGHSIPFTTDLVTPRFPAADPLVMFKALKASYDTPSCNPLNFIRIISPAFSVWLCEFNSLFLYGLWVGGWKDGDVQHDAVGGW
jgi:hypothetical protein